jgi:hypothetical protein
MADEKYFNFPIQLLSGFMDCHQTSLSMALVYHLYAHSLNLDKGRTEIDDFKSSCDYYGVKMGDMANCRQAFDTGKSVYNKYHQGSPKVGINLSKYWEFREEDKTDFEKVCLLAFLAIKSILGQKPYMKITNDFLLARMDGKSKACDKEALSPDIAKYSTEHQIKKIKNALQLNGWGLVTYARYTRGFYVSFKLTLEALIEVAEEKRESVKIKQLKIDAENTRLKVLAKLQNKRPP